MKLNAKYITHKLKDDKVVIGFECDTNFLNSIAFLKEGQEYQLELLKPKGNKSVAQNNTFWQVCREIAMRMDGDLHDLNEIYFNVLEYSGAKTYEITILKEAYDTFKKTIRHTKILDEYNDKGNDYYVIQCFPGISTYNSRDMSKLLDYTLDYAEKIGINTDIWRNN